MGVKIDSSNHSTEFGSNNKPGIYSVIVIGKELCNVH